MSPENPWKKFTFSSENNSNILEVDNDFISEYRDFLKSKKRKYKQNNSLHLELFPEPFEGNPNAPIYLLGGNPGYDKHDIYWCKGSDTESQSYLQLMRNNIEHKTEHFVFFERSIQNHKGSKWWNKRICDDLKNMIFNIEFFPYHSKKMNGLRDFLDQPSAKCLPSNKYVDSLIHNAIKERKVIIITRLEKYWIERISQFYKDIRRYKNLYILLNHQSAIVGNGNIVKYAKFETLKNKSYKEIVNAAKTSNNGNDDKL